MQYCSFCLNVFHFLLRPCEGMKLVRLPGKLLTLFKLDPDTGIILYLLYHLSVSANDDADSKSGHNDLNEGDSEKFFSPFYLFFKKRNNIVSSLLSVIKIKLSRGCLTSRLFPPIFDPKSALPTLKSPWSLSRISFTTSSRACYRKKQNKTKNTKSS